MCRSLLLSLKIKDSSPSFRASLQLCHSHLHGQAREQSGLHSRLDQLHAAHSAEPHALPAQLHGRHLLFAMQCMYAFTDWHNSWVQTLTMGTGSCM